MSVRVEADRIHLSGRCPAEDAEALLVALQDDAARAVDVGAVQKLHFAVLQVLLVAKPKVVGVPDNAFLAKHVFDLLR